MACLFVAAVAGLAVIGGLGALLAAGAGESLEQRLRNNGEDISSGLEHHTELGDAAKIFGVLFAIAVVAYVVIDHLVRRRAAAAAAGTEAPASEAPRSSSALKKYAVPEIGRAHV